MTSHICHTAEYNALFTLAPIARVAARKKAMPTVRATTRKDSTSIYRRDAQPTRRWVMHQAIVKLRGRGKFGQNNLHAIATRTDERKHLTRSPPHARIRARCQARLPSRRPPRARPEFLALPFFFGVSVSPKHRTRPEILDTDRGRLFQFWFGPGGIVYITQVNNNPYKNYHFGLLDFSQNLHLRLIGILVYS